VAQFGDRPRSSSKRSGVAVIIKDVAQDLDCHFTLQRGMGAQQTSPCLHATRDLILTRTQRSSNPISHMVILLSKAK
jgi:hypothetical protein